MINNQKLVKLLDTSGNNQTLAIVIIKIDKKKVKNNSARTKNNIKNTEFESKNV